MESALLVKWGLTRVNGWYTFLPMNKSTFDKLFSHQSELARRLGVSKQVINAWKKSRRVPAERVKAVSEVTGIPREKIRPDIFGDAA